MGTRNCRELVAQCRRDLEAQLQRRDVRQRIERLRETYAVFEEYNSVEELVALVGPGNQTYTDKEAVLRALLLEIRREAEAKREPRLFPLLSMVFWASLCDIFWRKVRSCPDPDDLLSRVRAGFYEVAVTYPLHRPGSIGGNLYWDTWKSITAWQREEAVYRKHHQRLEPADEPHVVLGDPREAEVHPEDMEYHLLGYVFKKVINETQYDLLLETKVYRRMTEKEWAKARDANYTTARSWCHRAEQAIQAYEDARRRTEQPSGP